MRSRRSLDDYAKFKEDVHGRCYAEISQVDNEYEQLKFLLSEDYHRKVAGQLELMGTQHRQLQADLFASHQELRVLLVVLLGEIQVLHNKSSENNNKWCTYFSWKRFFGSSRICPENDD